MTLCVVMLNVSIFCSVLSTIQGLNLRMEHFHCFSEHGDGGHFHYDVTPTEAEYVGYFNIAQYMFRVDNYPSDA